MIEVRNLTQTYRSGKGVFNLDFTINKGEVFGYLGPNGAGKTTTIRNLLGFANADKGRASINGLDCRKDSAELQSMIGYLPGETTFLDNMTGSEFLKFMNDMRGTKNGSRRDDRPQRRSLCVLSFYRPGRRNDRPAGFAAPRSFPEGRLPVSIRRSYRRA